MAFSRSPTLDRCLFGLCQYLVKNQEGISWMAQLVPDRGSKTGVYSSLPGAKNPGRKAKAKLMLNRYPFYVLFSCCHSPPPHHLFSFLEFSGANLANGLTSPPPSQSKIPPICSVYYPMPPSTSVPSNCALMTSWKPCIPVCMTMRSKALRPITLWHPSPLVPLG